MPVSYRMIIDLSHLAGHVVIETTFNDFGAAITARDKIMAGLTIRPVMSDPAGSIEAEIEGEGT